eukprot:2592852-Pyramimonas_sp.AAC.1
MAKGRIRREEGRESGGRQEIVSPGGSVFSRRAMWSESRANKLTWLPGHVDKDDRHELRATCMALEIATLLN